MKKLQKSRTDRMIFGVAGGLAHYFEVDVVLVRLLWVLAVMTGGMGLLAYIIFALIMPEEPKSEPASGGGYPGEDSTGAAGVSGEEGSETPPPKPTSPSSPHLFGYILILLGVYFLSRQFIPPHWWGQFWWFRPDRLWPLVIIAIGVAIIARRQSK